HIELYQLAGAAMISAWLVGLIRLATWGLSWALQQSLAFWNWKLPPGLAEKHLRPCGYLVACLVLRWGLMALDLDKTLLGIVLTILNPLAWVVATWAIFRIMDLIGNVSEIRMVDSKHRVEITEMLWPVGSLATKILIALGLILHLMALFSWDVTA